jgi:hypothetical protein
MIPHVPLALDNTNSDAPSPNSRRLFNIDPYLPIDLDNCTTIPHLPIAVDNSTMIPHLPIALDNSTQFSHVPKAVNSFTTIPHFPIELENSTAFPYLPIAVDNSSVITHLLIAVDNCTVTSHFPIDLENSTAFFHLSKAVHISTLIPISQSSRKLYIDPPSPNNSKQFYSVLSSPNIIGQLLGNTHLPRAVDNSIMIPISQWHWKILQRSPISQ